MDQVGSMELDEIIDGQKIRGVTIIFWAIATLALVADGFDLAAIGFVGPELVKEWHIAPKELVPAFSAGIVGLLFGAPTLGFVGDRFGRKTALLIGLCTFGIMTLATMAATSLNQLVVLRFLTGVGLGGAIPNVFALTAELAPKRRRGLFCVTVNLGVPLGISMPGWVAAALVPDFGWQVILLVGGLLPLVIAAVVFVLLPESLKYLAVRGSRDAEIARTARRIRPELDIPDLTRFHFGQASELPSRGSIKGLFVGGLALITPLLWIALAANQMANFFSLTWLPTLLQAMGASTAQAGVNASLFSIGGLIGGVCLIFVMDRFGVIPMLIMFLIGGPLVAAIGMSGLTPMEHGLIIAGAGFCSTGINAAMGATLSMIYPTPVRSVGVGWAQAGGRIGALAAPLVGGAMLASGYAMQELLLAPALVFGVGALACLGVAALCFRRFGGTRLNDSATPIAMTIRLATVER